MREVDGIKVPTLARTLLRLEQLFLVFARDNRRRKRRRKDYTFGDWLCWAIYCFVLPVRWNGSRFGMWLLPRAGRYAYRPSKAQAAEMEMLLCEITDILGTALAGPASLHVGHLPDMARDVARNAALWREWCEEAEKHGGDLMWLLIDAKHMGAGVFEMHLRDKESDTYNEPAAYRTLP